MSESLLDLAGGDHTVRVGSPATGQVARIPLEVYVARVLAGEGEPRAADAAQQALAIAIRTFAAANPYRHARDGYDLCDTTHCQVPRASTASSRRAALATAGRVLTYDGRPAEVFYCASCGGRTEAAADVWPRANLPYLRSVRDDVHADEPEWTATFPLARIEAALWRLGHAGALRGVAVRQRSGSRRVTRLELGGLQPETIAGDAFRRALGAGDLRSTLFDLDVHDGVARFTGRGYGHGVGMCVVGAGRRARRGEPVERILEVYFPGVRLTPA